MGVKSGHKIIILSLTKLLLFKKGQWEPSNSQTLMPTLTHFSKTLKSWRFKTMWNYRIVYSYMTILAKNFRTVSQTILRLYLTCMVNPLKQVIWDVFSFLILELPNLALSPSRENASTIGIFSLLNLIHNWRTYLGSSSRNAFVISSSICTNSLFFWTYFIHISVSLITYTLGHIHVYPLSAALFPRKSKGGANNATMLVICGAPWVIRKTMIWAIKVIGRGVVNDVFEK